jgi:hypothetical protein
MRDYDEDNDGRYPTKPRSKPTASAVTRGSRMTASSGYSYRLTRN